MTCRYRWAKTPFLPIALALVIAALVVVMALVAPQMNPMSSLVLLGVLVKSAQLPRWLATLLSMAPRLRSRLRLSVLASPETFLLPNRPRLLPSWFVLLPNRFVLAPRAPMLLHRAPAFVVSRVSLLPVERVLLVVARMFVAHRPMSEIKNRTRERSAPRVWILVTLRSPLIRHPSLVPVAPPVLVPAITLRVLASTEVLKPRTSPRVVLRLRPAPAVDRHRVRLSRSLPKSGVRLYMACMTPWCLVVRAPLPTARTPLTIVLQPDYATLLLTRLFLPRAPPVEVSILLVIRRVLVPSVVPPVSRALRLPASRLRLLLRVVVLPPRAPVLLSRVRILFVSREALLISREVLLTSRSTVLPSRPTLLARLPTSSRLNMPSAFRVVASAV